MECVTSRRITMGCQDPTVGQFKWPFLSPLASSLKYIMWLHSDGESVGTGGAGSLIECTNRWIPATHRFPHHATNTKFCTKHVRVWGRGLTRKSKLTTKRVEKKRGKPIESFIYLLSEKHRKSSRKRENLEVKKLVLLMQLISLQIIAILAI